jgi:opacity protein-like surface antigen
MKRFALPVCVAATLAAGAAVPAHSAEHGWYVGTGIGYSKGSVPDDAINNFNSSLNAAIPGASVTTVIKGEDSLMYQLFLGYSFTSFLALEANAFRLGDFNFNATISSPSGDANAMGSLDMWGGSLDVLGIIPLGDSWRIYGRAGVILVNSTANYQASFQGTPISIPDQDEFNAGWKLGAGVGYEFDSGVAFRGEYNYYKVDTAWGVKVNTQVLSGTVLYRFK